MTNWTTAGLAALCVLGCSSELRLQDAADDRTDDAGTPNASQADAASETPSMLDASAAPRDRDAGPTVSDAGRPAGDAADAGPPDAGADSDDVRCPLPRVAFGIQDIGAQKRTDAIGRYSLRTRTLCDEINLESFSQPYPRSFARIGRWTLLYSDHGGFEKLILYNEHRQERWVGGLRPMNARVLIHRNDPEAPRWMLIYSAQSGSQPDRWAIFGPDDPRPLESGELNERWIYGAHPDRTDALLAANSVSGGTHGLATIWLDAEGEGAIEGHYEPLNWVQRLRGIRLGDDVHVLWIREDHLRYSVSAQVADAAPFGPAQCRVDACDIEDAVPVPGDPGHYVLSCGTGGVRILDVNTGDCERIDGEQHRERRRILGLQLETQ